MKAIPPLSQSRESKLACAEFYALTEIDGVEQPPSVFSDRGNEVHHVMAQYALWCAGHMVPSDWEAFDRFSAALGPEAGSIVDGMRDNLQIDWEHFERAEFWMALDSDMGNTVPPFIGDDGLDPAYEGTLDALYINGTSAKIEDYKSHWRPFDADTFQSKLYPFLVFQHFPDVEEVTFELIFVRFRNARRSVTYTRADLPKLASEIERARKRQLQIHLLAPGIMRKDLTATPGSHCVYCPHLAKGTCPLGQQNPYDLSLTLEDRLRQVVYFDQARKHQTTIIKEFVDQSQTPVEFKAGEDKYTASFAATESGYFPLLPTVAILGEWVDAVPEDKVLFDRLRVGSTELKSKIKAKKRASLDQRLRDEVMVKETAVKFAITKNGEEEKSE